MHNFYKNTKTIAAVAAMGALIVTGPAQQARAQATGSQPAAQPGQPAAQTEKKYGQGEYEIYNEVAKDITNKQWTKALTDLDTWNQKFPNSDFKDNRTIFYVQAYQGAGQPAKAVDAAGDLINKNLEQTFTGNTGPQLILTFLFATTTSAQALAQTGNPSPEEIATGQKAAHMLMDFNKKPEGVADKAWEDARTQLQTAAKTALLVMATAPADKLMLKNPPSPQDCETASSIYEKALGDYPDKSIISYNLGRALNCMARANPTRATELGPKAIYEFVRAAVVDPSLGGTVNDPKKITTYADNAYTTYHGSDEGLQQLKDQAKNSPLPPPGFAIETAAAIATRKQNEFKEKYPEVALWLGIKSQLADANTGTQYFEGQLKNAAVPELKGTVVEGKPACRSKEILVAVPLPDQPQGSTLTPEISLKLDAPLTGKPEAGDVIQFQGVPTAFTQSPFMLTMDTEKAKIKNLKVAACAAPAGRGGAKKGAGRKR